MITGLRFMGCVWRIAFAGSGGVLISSGRFGDYQDSENRTSLCCISKVVR